MVLGLVDVEALLEFLDRALKIAEGNFKLDGVSVLFGGLKGELGLFKLKGKIVLELLGVVTLELELLSFEF